MSFSRLSPLIAGLLSWGLLGLGCQKAPEFTGPYNLPGSPPHLLAHYLPWFENGRRGEANWEHWQWSSENLQHDPRQRRADGRRDIASVAYPLIGPYSSSDPAVIRYHCETAKAAGIEGWIVLWYGPGSTTDVRMPLLLKAAQETGLKVALCYEEKLNWPPYRTPINRSEMVASAQADLIYAVETYAQHPAYLRRNGEPVIFQFNFWGTDRLGPRSFTPSEWEEIFQVLPEPVCYVRQNFEAKYHPHLAGSYHWWTPDEKVLQDHQRRVKSAIASGELRFHVGMIAPGFDDAGTDGWGGGRRFQARAGTETLRGTFSPALKENPELVQIVTWNDFNEGTEVEPTVEGGFAALGEIGLWWAGVKNSGFDEDHLRPPLRRYLKQLSADERAEVPAQAFQEANLSHETTRLHPH